MEGKVRLSGFHGLRGTIAQRLMDRDPQAIQEMWENDTLEDYLDQEAEYMQKRAYELTMNMVKNSGVTPNDGFMAYHQKVEESNRIAWRMVLE